MNLICKKLILISLIFSTFFSCKKDEIVDVTIKSELDKVVDSEFNRLQMPGLACLAVNEDSIVYLNFKGYANKNEKIDFNIHTRMIIASISKTITLTAVMQLYENGQVDLDADINNYLPFSVRNPNFPNDPITLRMLLTHTSSISDGGYSPSLFYLFGYVDYPETLMNFEKNYLTLDGEYFSDKSFSANKPGDVYKYSNVAVSLIACMVEHVTNTNFNDYCKLNIFDPLGMNKTTWFFNETPINEIAIPYADNNITNPSNPFFTYPTYPDGHLITTIEDLSKFMRAFIMDGNFNGTQLLQAQTIDTILHENISILNGKQGLIFFEHKIGQFDVWGHDGGDPGVSTELYFDRINRVGYIMFNNRTDAYSSILGNSLLIYAKHN